MAQDHDKKATRICHDRYDCRSCMSEHANHDAVTHRPINGYSDFTGYRVHVGMRPETRGMGASGGTARALPRHGEGREISSSAAPGTASGPGARAGLDGLKMGGASYSSSASAFFLRVNGSVLVSWYKCRGRGKDLSR